MLTCCYFLGKCSLDAIEMTYTVCNILAQTSSMVLLAAQMQTTQWRLQHIVDRLVL